MTLTSGQRIDARSITGSLSLTRWRLDVDPVDVQGPAGRVTGNLALRAMQPLGLRTDLRGEWRLPGDEYEYRFRVVTRGNLDRLGTDLYLDAPAKLSFTGTLLDLTEQPRAEGTLRMTDFDGSPWVPAERFPQAHGHDLAGSGRCVAGTRRHAYVTGIARPAIAPAGRGPLDRRHDLARGRAAVAAAQRSVA